MRYVVDWVSVREWLTALLSPAIAFLAFVVARGQAKIQKDKLKLDLWERRYSIFIATMTLLANIEREADCSDDSRNAFAKGIVGNEFLFGSDVKDYHRLLWRNCIDLSTHRRKLDSEKLPVGAERTKIAEANRILLDWFSAQLTESAREVFAPYLDFGTVR